MGKNIALLYMSAYFAQPAPEGSKNRFLRTQTNEAAVSALWKDPASRPDKIVPCAATRSGQSRPSRRQMAPAIRCPRWSISGMSS